MLLFIGVGAPTVEGATLAGRIAGDFAVNSAGGATYRIPIAVAAGQNGMKPDIALTYGSGRGDGLAGVGWAITGLSQITRCGLTPALDGKFQGVRFSQEDRYCLDGQPLIQVSTGNYWSGGQEYRTEVHNYEKITSVGSTGAGSGIGPQYFEVQHRDGLTYRYGFTSDSRVEAVGNPDGPTRVWALDEIRDTYNTRIFFSYEEDALTGEFRPMTIKWSARAGESENDARYRLKFYYKDRPEQAKRSGYVWGSVWVRTKRLKYISYDFKASANFARVHRYALNYETITNGSGRSVLGSVQQCGPGSDPDCLPATTFDSHTYVQGWQSGITGGESASEYLVDNAMPGDFNGDGRQDLFVPKSGNWHVLLGGWDSYNEIEWSELERGFSTGKSAATPGSTRIIDYNGDGLSDLLTPDVTGDHWYVYRSNGTTLSAININIQKSEFTDPIVMDLNGDGLDDILYRYSSSTMKVRINNGNGFDAPTVATNKLNGSGPDITYPGQRADFDGDGRDDYFEHRLCTNGEACAFGYWIRMYLSTGTTLDYQNEFDITHIALPYTQSFRVTDINGDGLSDLTFVGDGTWHVLLSHGDGLDVSVDTMIQYPEQFNSDTPYTFADYNIDGRDDLVVGVKGSGGGWTVYPSDGTTFTSTGIPLTNVTPPASDTVFAIDIGGTGYASLVFDDDRNEEWIAYGHEGGEGTPRGPDSLTNVTDGLGNYFNINARPVSRVASYSGNVTPPDEREFHAGSFYVVDNYESNDGTASGSYAISYLYTDPKQHMRGRGFLGFKSVKSTDSRDGTYSISIYRQDFPYTGRVDQVVRYQLDGKKITGFDPAWDDYQLTGNGGDNYYFVHLWQSPGASSITTEYEVDPDGGSNGQLTRTITHAVQYDFTHGAISQDVSIVNSPAHTNYFFTRVNTTFESFTGSVYCLGFPKQIDVKKSDSIESEQTRTVQYGYNSNCQRITETVGPLGNASQQLVTTFAVDAEGKITAITRDSGDGAAANRKTTIAWDTIGGYRRLTETEEIAGEKNLTVQHTWDYGLGLEASRTDPRGQSTAWRYDDFGRLELETRPGPATTTVTIENCSTCFPATAQYKVRSLRSDGFWSESFHDSYGRVVGQASVVLADAATTETRVAISYDPLGRVATKSLPYLTSNGLEILYSYDLRGRIKLERRPHLDPNSPLADTLRTYNRLNVVLKDATGSVTTYLHDAAGRLIETQAPLGSGTQNAYWPYGELKSITQGGASIKSLTYDARGFPATVTDIDSGTWSYNYSVFGELLSQTDDVAPTPNTIAMSYDQLGRPSQRVEAEGTTNWVYHQSGYGLGLLDEFTGPLPSLGHTTGSCTQSTGYCEQYSYDPKGRLQQTTHRFAGSSHITDYGYNNVSQITSVTYPAMLWANRYTFVYTYAHGHLDTVAKDMGGGVSETVYDVVNQDAFGNEELSKLFGTFGSGQAEYDHQRLHYATDGRIQTITTGVSPLGANAQNYDYTWNKTGDLSTRRDRNQADLTEGFSYDALHRLEKTFINSVETMDFEYYPNGNIYSKPDVGIYNYAGPAGSRGVTSITDGPRPNTYHYDANGNMDCRGDGAADCANGDAIEWTSFNKPKQVYYGSDFSAFDYGPNRRLVKQRSMTGRISRDTQYIGAHFERYRENGNKTNWRASIFVNGRVVYQLIEHQTTGACSSQQGSQGYFVLRDHQNSIDVLLNDGTSNDSRNSFDAFGKRRNVTGWMADTDDGLMDISRTSERGYTGHEHLDNVRLIHMRGRVQDPILGRMISPDPVLGNIRNPQSLNSYSYVMNNPVSLTDPSGFGPCPADTECITLGGTSGSINIYVVDFPDGADGSAARGEDKSGNDSIFIDRGALSRLSNRLDRNFDIGKTQLQLSLDRSSSLANINNLSDISQSIVNHSLGSIFQGGGSASSNQNPNAPTTPQQNTDVSVFGGIEAGTDIFAGIFGVSGSSGGLREIRENGAACAFNQVCVQLGFGGFVGVTGQALGGISSPLENGIFDTFGVFAIGAAGGGGFGTLDVNSSSLTLGGGFTEGIGGAMGVQFCRLDVFGCQ